MSLPKNLKSPAWLTGKLAKAYFYNRIKELPPLDHGQRELLAKASAEHEAYISLAHEIEAYQEAHGSIFTSGSQGQLVPHPACKLQQAHGESLRKWEAQLRITLKNESTSADTDEHLDELLFGGDE